MLMKIIDNYSCLYVHSQASGTSYNRADIGLNLEVPLLQYLKFANLEFVLM